MIIDVRVVHGAADPKPRSRTPHKPALPTTQPRAPPATPSSNSSTCHIELRVQQKKNLTRVSESKRPEHSQKYLPTVPTYKAFTQISGEFLKSLKVSEIFKQYYDILSGRCSGLMVSALIPE